MTGLDMEKNSSERSPFEDPIVKWLLGFFGAVLGFLLLPRTLKYVIRRFVFGTLGEIVAIVLTGLLTEKAVEFISKEEE